MNKLLLKIVFISVNVCSLIFYRGSYAETSPHTFEVGFDCEYFGYNEPNITIEGPMYGIVGNYAYKAGAQKIFNTSVRYSTGDLDYEGQTWGGTPLNADHDDWIFEWRALFGGDFFIGIGYRYWNDDSEGIGSYEREIQYLYSPIGFRSEKDISVDWAWGLNAEYDLFWKGKVVSYFSDYNPAYNDPEVNQNIGTGHGFRFSLRFDRKFKENYSLSIEPYLTYWEVESSTYALLTFNGVPSTYVFEPSNDTLTYGIRVSFRF